MYTLLILIMQIHYGQFQVINLKSPDINRRGGQHHCLIQLTMLVSAHLHRNNAAKHFIFTSDTCRKKNGKKTVLVMCQKLEITLVTYPRAYLVKRQNKTLHPALSDTKGLYLSDIRGGDKKRQQQQKNFEK